MTRKILCASDGGPAADIPVAYAAQLAATLGAALSIISVNVLLFNARGGSSHMWTDEKFDEVLERAVSAAKKAGMAKVEAIKAVGTFPASTIIDHAQKNGFDHIVVGHPKIGMAKLILGSVASEVAAKAHCPVTIAR